MRRRDFFVATGAAATAAAAPPPPQAATAKPVKMVLGCQSGPTSEERLQFFKRHAVDHICGYPENWENHYTEECVAQLRERCEKHGGSLTFESEVGKGSTFCIRIPFNATADEHAKAATRGSE